MCEARSQDSHDLWVGAPDGAEAREARKALLEDWKCCTSSGQRLHKCVHLVTIHQAVHL